MTMFTEPIKYSYGMNVKLSAVPGLTLVNNVFPNIEDLVISSKHFEKFEDAVASANKLTAEVVTSLNQAVHQEQYAVLSEINPRFTNKETISKDWAQHEVAKVWIVDQIAQKTKPGPIRAVGLAQLIEVHSDPVMVS